MKAKIQAAIEKIRPMLQGDGGDVELVDVMDGVVTRFLKQEVPEVKSVESA